MSIKECGLFDENPGSTKVAGGSSLGDKPWGQPQSDKERLDDICIDGMKVWQRTDQFCFSIDAVLLAHFVLWHNKRRYADLGTGTGIISLVASALGAGHVTAIEQNSIMAELAERNVAMNQRQSFIDVVRGDYLSLSKQNKSWQGYFDGVVVNPPYFALGQGKVSQESGPKEARHEVTMTLIDLVAAIRRLVKYRGRAWLIYKADRLVELMVALRQVGLEPKRLRMVHSRLGEPAQLVLLEALKGGSVSLQVEPPLYIYEGSTAYSEEVRHWYGRD